MASDKESYDQLNVVPRRRIPWRMLLLGIAVSATLLYLLMRQLEKGDWARIWDVLAGLNPWWMAVPIAGGLLSAILRPWRWQKIFPEESHPGYRPCFAALSVGNMTNNLVPARGGDLLRCFMISRDKSLAGASLALATLGLEKVLDGLALLAVLLISFLFVSPPRVLGAMGLIGGMIFGGAFFAIILLHYRTRWFLSVTRLIFRTVRLEALGERVATLFEWFAQGLGAVSSPATMTELAILTILIWAGDTFAIWGLALSLHLSVSVAGCLLVSAAIGLSQMVPSAPAAVGPYEAASVAALMLLRVKLASAMALTVLMHGWGILATVILGMAGLWLNGNIWSGIEVGKFN
ncbi:MAG TPA: lysylphosphatidylglycerol synthase transmembrane domain-containing protein [Candidatus Binataceae bacterium]|nr:lysylphosphatidylglycerol synthase transmembrane domain-containing protein [Candidatus Binataceae bacterium]